MFILATFQLYILYKESMRRIFIFLLGFYLISSFSLLYLFTREDPVAHAIISMGAGLILLWVIFCGIGMYLLRDKIKIVVQKIMIRWEIRFILFAIFLAMVEEAIAVTMTNLAPFFGVNIGQVHITASTNYLDVIFRHSVIVFIPLFITWAWLLKKYDFQPFWVFLIFGLSGIIAETLAFGPQNPIQFAMWIFVYGLMIYLPAYTIPNERSAKPPKFCHYLLAFILPFAVSIPWAIIINVIFPNHPSIHF